MYISKIYLMFTAEALLILLAICITLIIYIIKRPAAVKHIEAESEPSNGTGISYSEYLEKEILRNESKAKQQAQIEKEDNTENPDKQTTDEKQSQLLQLREMFLKTEQSSVQHTEDENTFWNTLYSGLKDIHRQFKTIEKEVVTTTEQTFVKKESNSEKVFYIETQGKKVDSEINRLKDIIFDQDGTLNSLKHALDSASSHLSDENQESILIKSELTKFEQQLSDSKMCMEVLEMENERLQSEISNLEMKLQNQTSLTLESSPALSDNMNQLKETLSGQELQINTLNETIDSMKLDSQESEQLKSTIKSFARGSKEMMDCITILEEENNFLHQQIEDLNTEHESASANSDTSSDELKNKIKSLEKEIIKKDVAYAKLQDEFSNIEKEYLSIYEQVHGEDN